MGRETSLRGKEVRLEERATNLQVSRFFDWLVKRNDNVLPFGERSRRLEILAHRFPSHREFIWVNEPLLKQELHHGGDPANCVQVLHHVLATWFEVGDKRHRIAHLQPTPTAAG
jgi:hypothetical protein